MEIAQLDQFEAVIQRSRLLTDEQLEGVREYMHRRPPPSVVKTAQWMVNRQFVTLWQASRLLAGSTAFFLGQYKFIEPIAEGAMGVVFKAQHAVMGRTVAVKVLSKARLSHPNAIARFRREVQAAAALDHPNIVTAYDAGQIGNTHYLVMQYINGVDLTVWQEKYQKIPIAWACEFIRQSALGLGHAHSQGLVHRDIKPANILVAWNESERKPVVKVLDLGLARVLHEADDDVHPPVDLSEEAAFTLGETVQTHLTQAGTILGTPDYLAPEQIMHKASVDARTDIFGLGCTLFRLLTGQLPYGGHDLLTKLQNRVSPSGPPAVRLRTLVPEADPRLEAVIARMLERDPARRFQTAEDVAEALAPFAEAPRENWETFPRRPDDESSEIGSSQMEFDPHMREFFSRMAGDGGQAASFALGRRDPTRPPMIHSTSETRSAQGSPNVLTEVEEEVAIAAPRPIRHPPVRRRKLNPWYLLLPVCAILLLIAAAMLGWNGEPSHADWPGDPQGLVFLWYDQLGRNEVPGEETLGLQPRPCRVIKRDDAAFDEDGAMRLSGNGAFLADDFSADRVAALCRRADAFTFEAVVWPSERAQTGVIVESGDEHQRNFRLAQRDEWLVLHLNTSQQDFDAPIRIARLPVNTERHLVVSYRPGHLQCFVDGRPAARPDGETVQGDLSSWENAPLIFGQNTQRKLGWRGWISGVSLRARALDADEAQNLYRLILRRRQNSSRFAGG